ncbi:uncharacterized protein LOC116766515 [Danaus plexippus]|uniref:uncharacterized protein LOC116766515 n=1 Tax=Danaus plexippus TaxID=13037 RepID=UPI002AB1E92F|nr:uncharacterized protein LOC116766515 [Danaus plexippus]
MYKLLLIYTTFAIFCGVVIAQTVQQRCYRFTWLGPDYNNGSIFLNATCQDATRLADGVPCQMPLVASYDGSWPDVDYIWNHHKESATCVLSGNDVCAQFTYFFNGKVENSTYMCTRAINANFTAITSGCYEEQRGSYSSRVCFCRSVPGGVPCNSAVKLTTLPVLSFFIIMMLFIWPY